LARMSLSLDGGAISISAQGASVHHRQLNFGSLDEKQRNEQRRERAK
jgi:hypothetical protein